MEKLFMAQFRPTLEAAWENDTAEPQAFEQAAHQMFCSMVYEGDYPQAGDPSAWKSFGEARGLVGVEGRAYRIVQVDA